jgi:hypothetical protein
MAARHLKEDAPVEEAKRLQLKLAQAVLNSQDPEGVLLAFTEIQELLRTDPAQLPQDVSPTLIELRSALQ